MAFKLDGKEMYPIFVFAKCFWSCSSLLSGKVWQACSQQTEKKHSHTNSAVSRQVCFHALQVYVHAQWRSQPKIWGGKIFDFKWLTLFCLEKRLWKHKMTIFSKNLAGAIAPLAPLATPMCMSCYPLNFAAVRFVWLKKLQLTVQVSCIFYFLLLSRFFRGKVNSGFYCFF